MYALKQHRRSLQSKLFTILVQTEKTDRIILIPDIRISHSSYSVLHVFGATKDSPWDGVLCRELWKWEPYVRWEMLGKLPCCTVCALSYEPWKDGDKESLFGAWSSFKQRDNPASGHDLPAALLRKAAAFPMRCIKMMLSRKDASQPSKNDCCVTQDYISVNAGVYQRCNILEHTAWLHQELPKIFKDWLKTK